MVEKKSKKVTKGGAWESPTTKPILSLVKTTSVSDSSDSFEKVAKRAANLLSYRYPGVDNLPKEVQRPATTLSRYLERRGGRFNNEEVRSFQEQRLQEVLAASGWYGQHQGKCEMIVAFLAVICVASISRLKPLRPKLAGEFHNYLFVRAVFLETGQSKLGVASPFPLGMFG